MEIIEAKYPLLSLVLFLPLIGTIVGMFFLKADEKFVKTITILFSAATFVLSIGIVCGFTAGSAAYQWVERKTWIEGLGVQYYLGVDGLSLFLVILTTFMGLIAVIYATTMKERSKGFMLYMLLAETGMLGVFMAMDFILFFLFWEVMLVPLYLIIGIWGGEGRLYATLKVFLYTLFGSIFMFVGIIAIYMIHGNATGEYTFDILKLYDTVIPQRQQFWIFLALFMGFAIKAPLIPLHTWLPHAYKATPIAANVILAGVMTKMGIYGFIRFNLPILPDASYYFVPVILALAVVGMVYGALIALAQKDIKNIVAYASLSHLGYIAAGVFAMNAEGIDGSVIQMINHGIYIGALFLIVGMLFERRQSWLLKDYGNAVKTMPIFATIFFIVVIGAAGIPGGNGFIGEFLIMVGLFAQKHWLAGAVMALGITVGVAYKMGMYQKLMIFKGKEVREWDSRDVSLTEAACLVPLALLVLYLGL
ncbi:MAG: NADH-quinone oxidoreductase subunit M, partial [Proteobacteria bacterium]|nr:NADH-quinone oxidoreductase subunit M [Pseudomonadota bacterium]